MLQDLNRRTPFSGSVYDYVSRPSYAPSARGTYRPNTPYRSYYDNRASYQDNARQSVQQSIERTPHNDRNRFQNRTSYNSTPWNERRLDSLRRPTQMPDLRQSATSRQPGPPDPLVKREDDSRRTPFRTRAYHTNEDETQDPDYDGKYDTSYEAYEHGFYKGQNVVYWTQEAMDEQINEPEPHENNNTNDKRPDSEGMEHTDAHIAAIKDISCRICKTPFLSRNKLHNHLEMSNCLKAEARISGSVYEDGRNLRRQLKDSCPRSQLDGPGRL